MQWEFTPYAVPLLMCLILLSGLFTVSWQRRATPGAIPLLGIVVTVGAYVVGYALEVGSATPEQVLTSLKIEYLSVFAPGLLLMVVVHYAADRSILNTINLTVLFSIAIATIILAFTNEYHGLIWNITELNRESGFTRTIFTSGPWYWVSLIYTRGLIGVCLLILIYAYRRLKASVYRRQISTMIAALSLPFVATLLYIANVFPPGFDIVPYALTMATLVMAWAIFRFRLLDVMPIAREAILQSMSEAVFVLDTESRLIYLNNAAQSTSGFNANTVIGSPAAEVFAQWSELAKQYQRNERRQVEITAVVQGQERHFNLDHVPLMGKNRTKGGRLLVLTDITQRVKAEQALKEAYNEREKLVQDLEAFTHMVAHDLKNPLSTVIGLSDILQTDFTELPPDEVRSYLNSIHKSGKKADTIIDALLVLARIRSGVSVEIGTLDMGRIVTDVQHRLEMMIGDIKATVIKPETWAAARGYGPWVEEIWINYFTNALKYGGQPPIVEFGSTPQPDGSVRFWVKDNGPGLTEEQIGRLFTPFSRLTQRSVEGYGLGLTVVQRIAEHLHGTVGVESEVGKGSTFYFTLPGVPTIPPKTT
ncbi:MAG: histidine kinase N-terminal 7TM domain-containing protein [Anaerolineae bacterium]